MAVFRVEKTKDFKQAYRFQNAARERTGRRQAAGKAE